MGKKKRRIDYWKDPDAPKPTSRKPSASVLVRDASGSVLMLRRADNGFWTIPTGGMKKGETAKQCAVRECREETGIEVEITGLVGVFTTPDHVIEYRKGKHTIEVRQPVNICLRARPVGGTLKPEPSEASDVEWVMVEELSGLDIHPALRLRIDHGLSSAEPYVD